MSDGVGECVWCHVYKRERDEAREELAQSLTGEEHVLVKKLRAEIRKMQVAAEARNRELDALGYVWCDGGCEGGVHRFDGQGPEAITEEVVQTVVRNAERLQRWWRNRQARVRDAAARTEEVRE